MDRSEDSDGIQVGTWFTINKEAAAGTSEVVKQSTQSNEHWSQVEYSDSLYKRSE